MPTYMIKGSPSGFANRRRVHVDRKAENSENKKAVERGHFRDNRCVGEIEFREEKAAQLCEVCQREGSNRKIAETHQLKGVGGRKDWR